jgi:hypothetical protein
MIGRLLADARVRYPLAVLGYVGGGWITKHYMSFAWGLTYFITVLEVLPRTVARLRRRRAAGRPLPALVEPVGEP